MEEPQTSWAEISQSSHRSSRGIAFFYHLYLCFWVWQQIRPGNKKLRSSSFTMCKSQVFGELCMGQMVRYGKMPGFTTIGPSALIHFLAVCLSCVQSAPTVLYVGMQVSGWFPFRTVWCHPATLLAPVSWPEWPSPNLCPGDGDNDHHKKKIRQRPHADLTLI